MEENEGLNKDLLWLCFVNYVKTYEDAGTVLPVEDGQAKEDIARDFSKSQEK